MSHFEREQRELEFARIVAFSDGVFAIAMTLLVLALHIPEGVADLDKALKNQLPDFLAFALSFAVLGQIWFFHHRFFGSLRRYDATLITLNFLYLFLVALVPFTSEVIGDYGHQTTPVVIYAVNIAGLGLIGGLMVRYSFDRELVDSEVADLLGIHGGPANWFVGAVFVISIPIAIVSPHAAEGTWLVLLAGGAAVLRRLIERRATA